MAAVGGVQPQPPGTKCQILTEAVEKRVCRGRRADLNSHVVAGSARLSRHSGPDCLQQRSDTDDCDHQFQAIFGAVRHMRVRCVYAADMPAALTRSGATNRMRQRSTKSC